MSFNTWKNCPKDILTDRILFFSNELKEHNIHSHIIIGFIVEDLLSDGFIVSYSDIAIRSSLMTFGSLAKMDKSKF